MFKGISQLSREHQDSWIPQLCPHSWEISGCPCSAEFFSKRMSLVVLFSLQHHFSFPSFSLFSVSFFPLLYFLLFLFLLLLLLPPNLRFSCWISPPTPFAISVPRTLEFLLDLKYNSILITKAMLLESNVSPNVVKVCGGKTFPAGFSEPIMC